MIYDQSEVILKHQAYGTSLMLHKTQLELYQVLHNRRRPENLMMRFDIVLLLLARTGA